MMTRVCATILVVDDDAAIRDAVARLLISAGYRALEAADSAMALELTRSEQPTLAIIDVDMPGMSGMVALNLLRRRGFELPVLMLSGMGGVEHRLEALGFGADDYMSKPFDPRELLARVAALLRRGRKVTRASQRKWQRGEVMIDL